MFNKIILTILLVFTVVAFSNTAYSAERRGGLTEYREVDSDTFNEYRYKITDEYYNFMNRYEIYGKIDVVSGAYILSLAKDGYRYLPDNLINKNIYSHLITSIEKGIKNPNSSSSYIEIKEIIEQYLDKTSIQEITGKVEAFPEEGNAPLTVTLRGREVTDPSGAVIPSYNYTWWMYVDGERKIIGDGLSYTNTFTEEGIFSVFLDVTSNHKNKAGYTDVLPFRGQAEITVKEKVASVIIKVNSTSLKNNDELKFTPEEARYGLLFDATSSTATEGSKFIETTWNFGNGVIRKNDGGPKIERILYPKEGNYKVTLSLKTNELNIIERKFDIGIHSPIAKIKSSQDSGYFGDKFTFSAQDSSYETNLTYAWEIIDLNKDEIILRKSGSSLSYTFNEKGKYNVKMVVYNQLGETDIDSKIIYINSRAPIVDLEASIPFSNSPNKVLLDASKTFDPDFSDDGKLKYRWLIDGNRIKLEESNEEGSKGYFTFDYVGSHSIKLEVEDPDNIISKKEIEVEVKSLLSGDFTVSTNVAPIDRSINFNANFSGAKFYVWDFGDGYKSNSIDPYTSHSYSISGEYTVILKVKDKNNEVNTFSKKVNIAEKGQPFSSIKLTDKSEKELIYDQSACNGDGAYISNRVETILFSGKESINDSGSNSGLTYSWKIGKATYKSTKEFLKKFDETGCFPIKLTVKNRDGKINSNIVNLDIVNLKPVLGGIDIRVMDETASPIIINVSALKAYDIDGVIQSYLWYYYTDVDSEPQDIRITKTSQTSFVLPKITGNYYFVVVMKDNNEEKLSSEDIENSNNFITLTGNNSNTPLLKVLLNDSNIAIGDEAVFTVNVENIFGQNLNDKVKYSWDFDGDGFYDEDTTLNIMSHRYDSSGEKHVKVKAVYKGFSNVKTITVNVSNILKPDFGYISIGNEYIFFDKSTGEYGEAIWDLGDGTIIKDKKFFTHKYSDGKNTHNVVLKILEGTKVKEVAKKVVKDIRNVILARKEGLVLFSDPKINEENEIVLKDKRDDIYIYLGESKPDIGNYVIDNDIEYDSDINGGNDDDEDNKSEDSYTSGKVFKVDLNKNKFQSIRLFVKNNSGTLVDSQDVTIVKEYIEEKTIDVDTIVFDGLSESSKVKIEKLKELITSLPKQHRFKGLMYIQKLQEEWEDTRERTNIILDLEGFIYDSGVKNQDEIIDLLESLLVGGGEQNPLTVTFNALKNLIPTTIVCKDADTGSMYRCYNNLVDNLEYIRDNDDVELNKELGTEILNAIGTDTVMSTKEKTDFKAILKTLVYGGVKNIPEEEELCDDANGDGVCDEEQVEPLGFTGLLMSILKWLLYIILGGIFIIGLYYIYYLISNKDKNIGFQDFIIDKTGGSRKNKDESKKEKVDVLEGLEDEEKIKEEEPKKEEINKEKKPIEVKKEEVNNNQKETKIADKEVPAWIKGNTNKKETKAKEIKKEEIKEKVNDSKKEIKTDDKEVPAWLKGNTDKKELKKEEVKEEITDKQIEEETKIGDKNVPDWLKGSFKEETKKEEKTKTEPKKEEKEVKKEEVKEKVNENKEETKVDDKNVPDWLKGSFTEETNKEEKTKTEPKKEEKAKEVKKEEVKEKVNENKEETKVDDKNVPDWLKGSIGEENGKEEKTKIEPKKEEKEVKKEEVTEKVNENKEETKVDDKNVPDWLKGSLEEETKIEDKTKTEEKKEKVKEDKSKKEVKKVKKEEVKKEDKTVEKKVTTKKTPAKPKTKKAEEKKVDNTKVGEGNKQTNKAETGIKEKNDTASELWDDGMKVPDWLKTEEGQDENKDGTK